MTTITIASIETKDPRSVVITTDNKRLGFWTESASEFNFKVGSSYEVELTHKTLDGGRKLTNITKATEVAAPPPATTTNGSGYSCRTPEQLFVQGILEAYIGQGKCANPAELKNTIATLRDAWKCTFGFDDRVFTPSEAGRRVA